MWSVRLVQSSPTRRAVLAAVAFVAVAAALGSGSVIPSLASEDRSVVSATTVTDDPAAVSSVLLAIFADRKIPVSLVSPERGVIRTGSVEVSQSRLRQLVRKEFESAVDRFGRQGGRFVMQVGVAKTSQPGTTVTVSSMIVMRLSDTLSPAGGQIMRSNGALEKELLTALSTALRVPR